MSLTPFHRADSEEERMQEDLSENLGDDGVK